MAAVFKCVLLLLHSDRCYPSISHSELCWADTYPSMPVTSVLGSHLRWSCKMQMRHSPKERAWQAGFRPCSAANWGKRKRKTPEAKPQMVLISVPHSLLTTDVNIFKKDSFPKGSFLLLQKKTYFKIPGKALKGTPWHPQLKSSFSPNGSLLPGAGHKTAKLCCTLRLEGNWQAYCQMEYYTIWPPQKTS